MEKEHQYIYEFMIHNSDDSDIKKYEIYIHEYVTPNIQKLSESFLIGFQISNLKIRYGITIEGISNVFSLTASLFCAENDNNKIIGNILFPNAEQYHQVFDLNQSYDLKDLSLQLTVSVEYYKRNYKNYKDIQFLYNDLLFGNILFINFFTVIQKINDNDCLEYENQISNVTIEVLHTLSMSYWQIYKKENRKLIYSFPKKFKEDNKVIDILRSLREIEYVFKKAWCNYEMLNTDLDSLVKMAKLQNY